MKESTLGHTWLHMYVHSVFLKALLFTGLNMCRCMYTQYKLPPPFPFQFPCCCKIVFVTGLNCSPQYSSCHALWTINLSFPACSAVSTAKPFPETIHSIFLAGNTLYDYMRVPGFSSACASWLPFHKILPLHRKKGDCFSSLACLSVSTVDLHSISSGSDVMYTASSLGEALK